MTDNPDEGNNDIAAQIAAEVEKQVAGLKSKNEELIGKYKSERERASSIENEKSDLLKRLEAIENEKLEKETDVKKIREQLESKHQKSLDELKSALSEKENLLQKLVIDNGITEALAKNNVAPHHIPAVKALMKAENKFEISNTDGNLSAQVNGQGLSDYVKDWTSSDVGKFYVAASQNGGGGASGAGRGSKGADVKTVTRADFDGMSYQDKMSFVKEGGKVVNE